MSKKILLPVVAMLLAITALYAQVLPLQIPLWDGVKNRYVWYPLDTNVFKLVNGQLTVVLPPAPLPSPVSKHDQLIVRVSAPQKDFPLPVVANYVAVHRNGLLQAPGIDYTNAPGNLITFVPEAIPQSGDVVIIIWEYFQAPTTP